MAAASSCTVGLIRFCCVLWIRYVESYKSNWIVSKKRNNCPYHCAIFRWQCCVRIFSHSGLVNSHSFYCDKACAAYSRCVQLSSYAGPEITSFVPHAALHHLPCVVQWQSCMGRSLGTRLLSLWIRMQLAKKQSPSKFIALHSCAICDHCFTKSSYTCSNYWNSYNHLRTGSRKAKICWAWQKPVARCC